MSSTKLADIMSGGDDLTAMVGVFCTYIFNTAFLHGRDFQSTIDSLIQDAPN